MRKRADTSRLTSVEEERLRKAYRGWLMAHAPTNSIAVTLTMSRSRGDQCSLDISREGLRVYARMLNSKAYGNAFRRGERQLALIPIREGGDSHEEKNPHYHLVVEIPEGWTTHEWVGVAEDKLRRVRCFSNREYVIKPVADDGWLEYILKKRDKKSFSEAMDAANLWVESTKVH